MTRSREELELDLLRAQLRQYERQASWLAPIGQVVTGVIVSIVASLILGVAVFAFGEGWIDSLIGRRDDVTAELARLGSVGDSLMRERDALARSLAALTGRATLYDQGIALVVDFPPAHSDGSSLVRASSSSPGVSLAAYEPCPGIFSFPGEVPAFGSGRCQRVPPSSARCEQSSVKTECLFGPFLVLGDEVGIWIVAALEGKRAVRYVSLSRASKGA